jgi:tetratricopeptide (TPR) repeat protein
MKIRLVTAVWGNDFVSLYLKIALRSLLADGNIPDLAKFNQVVYTIYTTKEDVKALQASETFNELQRYVDVQFRLFTKEDVSSTPTEAHHQLWDKGLKLAKKNGQSLFVIIPDLLYGKGTLLSWTEQLLMSDGAVYSPSSFVTLETVLDEIEARFPGNLNKIQLEKDEIHDLLLRHLHPLAASMLDDSPRRAVHPEHYTSAISPGQGLNIRVFASQPFCINPSSFDSIKYLNPEDHLSKICFAPCTTVSLEPLLKSAGWYYRPNLLDSKTAILNMGAWWAVFGTPASQLESKHSYEIVPSKNILSRKGLLRAKARGLHFRARLTSSTIGYKIWKAILSSGNKRAADLVALAHYLDDFWSGINISSESIFLVPSDLVFHPTFANGLHEKIISSERLSFLQSFLKDHILSPYYLEDGTSIWKNANGTLIHRFNTKTITESMIVNSFRIYIYNEINNDFISNGLLNNNCSSSGIGSDSATISTEPSKPPSNINISSIINENASMEGKYVDLYVNNITHSKKRDVLRYLMLRTELLPGGDWLNARLLVLIRTYLSKGRVGVKEIIFSKLKKYRILKCSALVLKAILSIVTRGWRYFRQNGLSMTALHILYKLKIIKNNFKYSSRFLYIKPTDISHQTLQQFQHLRVLEAAIKVLEHYEKSISLADHTIAPLALIRKRLLEIGMDQANLLNKLEISITSLLDQYPTWSQALFELGFLKLDQGDTQSAIIAFERASKGHLDHYFSSESSNDPRIEASAVLTRLYISEGLTSKSRLAIKNAENDIGANLNYALHLWQIGDVSGAAHHFGKSMDYYSPKWTLPNMPRHISLLNFSLLT